MLEGLSNILKKSIDKISSAIFVDKTLIDSIVKDLQRALIMADVNIKLISEISNKIKKEGESRVKGIEKKEHLIKLLNDEITNIIGGEKKELILGKKDTILFVGLYGTGKTTTIAKLASYYKKRGKNVAMLGLDVHRPAASEQLEQLGHKIEVPVFVDKNQKNALKVYEKYKKELEQYDLVLVDSAGRDALEKSLIKEIKEVSEKIKATHTILVIAADIGQAAKNQASTFKESCNINGVIITRMDSSAKAGGALTACYEVNAPVYFIGTGEKMNDIEIFNPKSFVSRLLGMGDLESLIEKVKTASGENQEKMSKRLEEGKFSLIDLYEQINSMQNMGPLSKITELIPGFSKAKIPEEMLGNQEEKIKGWKHAIASMTKEEIENPEILEKQTSRISRISKGSGVSTGDIRQLIKQYKMIKELMGSAKNLSEADMTDPSKLMSQKQMMKFAKKFGKKKFRM
ncbi:MAG TPA: signal recognition particle receptor subunit alpha [Candidatus Paceibacterota bacterium]|nr:signal recognition particle receptor subunit alpha [Candidatus Paceibacterota bacterium]